VREDFRKLADVLRNLISLLSYVTQYAKQELVMRRQSILNNNSNNRDAWQNYIVSQTDENFFIKLHLIKKVTSDKHAHGISRESLEMIATHIPVGISRDRKRNGMAVVAARQCNFISAHVQIQSKHDFPFEIERISKIRLLHPYQSKESVASSFELRRICRKILTR